MQKIFGRVSKGLLAFLPVMILIWIFSFVYQVLAGIFFALFGVTDNNLWATCLIVICSLVLLFYVGYLVEKNRESLILRFTEVVIGRIPLVKTLYNTIKEVIGVFSGGDKRNYLGVVYVRFGNARAMGFITKEESESYWVFVPTTPNPTSGLLLSFPKDQVETADIEITDGFKKIISLGLK